jgi:zinc/manganese transport system permease protein
MSANPTFTPHLVTDWQELTEFPFMLHALWAGTIVAVLAASVGWYAVTRRQAFASHTLSVMAFPGATGAALIGLPISLGYYIACGAAALAMSRGAASGSFGESDGARAAAIGTVQTVGLAAGFLFLSLNSAVLGGPETLLFGSILGVSSGQVIGLLGVAAVTLALLVFVARPLLFASLDADVARARGVPVRALEIVFVLLLGAAVAATSQITGALLVFALLITPAASAQQVTTRPFAGLLLSVGFALLVVWLGLIVAYFSVYPVGFYVTTFAFALYVITRLGRAAADRRR